MTKKKDRETAEDDLETRVQWALEESLKDVLPGLIEESVKRAVERELAKQKGSEKKEEAGIDWNDTASDIAELNQRLDRIEQALDRIEELIDFDDVEYACPKCGQPLQDENSVCPNCNDQSYSRPTEQYYDDEPDVRQFMEPKSQPGYDPSPAANGGFAECAPNGFNKKTHLCPQCCSSTAYIPGRKAYYCPKCRGYLNEKTGEMFDEKGRPMEVSRQQPDGWNETVKKEEEPVVVARTLTEEEAAELQRAKEEEEWEDNDNPLQDYKAYLEFKGGEDDWDDDEDEEEEKPKKRKKLFGNLLRKKK